MSLSSESEWMVYRVDGAPSGPLSTSSVADAILTGKLPPDVWIAAPGGTRWLRALEVPVIAKLIEGLPTRRHRESQMRTVPTPAVLPPPKNPPLPPAPPPAPVRTPPPMKKLDETVKSVGTVTAGAASSQVPTPRSEVVPMTDRDSEPAPTIRSTNPRGVDGFPIPMPEPTPTPTPTPPMYRGGETLESPQSERSRKKTLSM